MTVTDTPYSPAQVDAAITQVRRLVLRECALWAADTQAIARRNAPWTDRGGADSVTGRDARESLEAEAGVVGERVLIVLRSTRESTRQWKGGPHAPVGAFLELSTRRMRKFPVLWPTLEHEAPMLKARLTKVLNP